ncbi:hypothetical protein EZV62_026244 [Acer yangbiense]|uniref:Uncharacterized protein n=1 Tax=Acer yangbiense TaxID=1000413 RepID=A0A5C7GR06_9ROSI|nr:hypothetical protein EZV62_026244 [Acer yangbiense]
MSADDGGSFDLDETEDQGSVGTNAFITPLAQYKPHDDHLGLRRRRRTNVSYSDELNLIRSEPAVAPNHRSLFPNHIRRIMFITWPFNDICKILNNAADHILKVVGLHKSKPLKLEEEGTKLSVEAKEAKHRMMEDHFIENNNGLNGRIDLDETEDQGSVGTNAFITPLPQYKPHDDHLGLRRRRRTNVSYSEDDHQYQETHIQYDDHFPDDHLGTNAFAQYKPHYGHCRAKMMDREETPDLSSRFRDDDDLDEGHCRKQMMDREETPDLSSRFRDDDDSDEGLCRKQMDRGETPDLGSRFKDDDYLDEVSQMISPPAVIAEAMTDCNLNLGTASFVTARHTEQIITPSSLLLNTPHRIDIQEDLAGVDGVSQMISPPTVIAAARTDGNLNLATTASVVTDRPRYTEQRITPLRIDIPEGNSNDEEVHDWSQKMDFEWIFVITNIVLESMSAIFTQLSSKQKPQYALLGMLLSYLALLTCIIELIYEGRRHRQIPIGRRRRGKSFATLNNIVALACALGQCVVTTINYSFQSPIKLTISPIILANGVLFSKILKYRQRETL